MGSRSLFVAAVLCTFLLSVSGFAAPITYLEGTDLPATGSPLTSFTLDVGPNTVSGTTTVTTDLDSFAFVVPAGMSVTAASVTLADLTGNVILAKWTLFQGSANSGTGTSLGIITAASPSITSFTTATPPISLPLAADTYNLTAGSLAGSGSSSYTFSFTVTPEPASLGLLALAAPLLGRRPRRA